MTKRILSLLLAVLLAAPLLGTVGSAKQTRRIGDLNRDEQLTVIDYIMLKRYILETLTLSEDALSVSDLNADGCINVLDYVILKRVILGTYELPEQEPEKQLSEEAEYMIGFSVLLKSGSEQVLLQLENRFGLQLNALGEMVLRYIGSLTVDDTVLAELEKEWTLRLKTQAEIEAFLQEFLQLLKDHIGLLPG